MTTTTGSPEPEEQPEGAPQPAQREQQWQENLKTWAVRKGIKQRVGEAMQRWGAGVPESIREEIGGKKRFDKFTERAKRVLALAEQEARRMNHNYIGTEHILLGLTAEGDGLAAKVLSQLEVSLDQVRRGVEYVVGRGDQPIPADRTVSLTPRAKKVIALSIEEARSFNHNYIGTEHLLLGLVREGEGVAAGVLESMGASMDLVRTSVSELLASQPGGGPPAVVRDNVISCRVAAADLVAIDLLVEAGIRSTRSDAAQWLIHAGVAANKSLFDEVQDTVAEIKRLRDQAREAAQRLAGEGTSEGTEGEE